ncbi:hypothetical protein, partial [Actinophytocola sp.]|uniref:hypothetical protein n=1 Tax=Actinophytocola sp. TaxID=1872138 RepID=UPI002ED48536
VPSWRDASGEWESSVYGGSLLSGPPDDPPPPPVRAGTIEWINESSTEFYAEDDSDETTTMRMLLGEAAGDVHRLRIRTPEGDEYEHPVHHPPGLVVIGVLGTRPALVTVLDTQGQAQSSRRV